MKSFSRVVVAAALQLVAAAPPAFAADKPAAETTAVASTAASREVAATTQAFYRALHDRDEAAIERFISGDGFTEFPGNGSPLQQKSAQAIQQVIAQGTVVDVRLEDLRVDMLSADVALVTGYRNGVVGASASVAPQKRRMSLLWVKRGEQWQLAHAHFSPGE